MSSVLSTWAASPITVDGTIGPEWAGAGIMPIPAGYLLVKNDAQYFYAVLDLVGDTGNDPGTGDYYWFTFDVDRNVAITPHQDTNYGPAPGVPNVLRRQYYLGPGTWTGLQNPTTSQVRSGFAVTPQGATPHRLWEFRFDLAEIGADLGMVPTPVLRVGMRVSSTTPAFTFDHPANFYTDFSGLHQVHLATAGPYPPGTEGVVIGGVGVIPAARIDAAGYATTAPGYYLVADDAAFGGRMNLLSNRVTIQHLWNGGARRYRVDHRLSTDPGFAPLDQTWSNSHWVPPATTLEQFAPDANHTYPLLDPGQQYSINDLLLQWSSVGFAPGLHEFQVQFFSAAGVPVAAPAQTLRLRLDNNPPAVSILAIEHNGTPIPPCTIMNLGATDGVTARITVNDPEGHLKDYALQAHYGAAQVVVPALATGSYPVPHPANHQWTGVTNATVPVPPAWPAGKFVPPQTCAYQFRLSATPRVTNGYGYIGYVETTSHITLVKAGSPIVTAVQEVAGAVAGISESGEVVPGEHPARLGADTLA
jgi:hypothetical protein